MSGLSKDNTLLAQVAKKLGVKSADALKKCEEYLRILDCKCYKLGKSDTAKIMICLDIATKILGITFDKETALEIANMSKAAYQTSLNNVEKVLNLDKLCSINEMCVQLSVTVIQDLAQEIFDAYKSLIVNVDCNTQQYFAVSVYTACKLKKIKVDKAELVQLSRLKSTQWNELVNSLLTFVKNNEHLFGTAQSTKTKKSGFYDFLDEHTKNSEITDGTPKYFERSDDDQAEDYEIWRKRILDEARAALEI